jgi:hypothetical protein
MTPIARNINNSDAIRALHTFTSLAVGTGQAQNPPFSYGPLDGNGNPTAPNQFPLTKDNCEPALVVWLFLVTNPVYLNVLDGAIPVDPQNPQMIPVPQIAQAVNLTENAVTDILNVYTKSSTNPKDDNNLRLSFRRVNQAFQDLANNAGYVAGTCPDSGQAMVTLAQTGALIDPNSQE